MTRKLSGIDTTQRDLFIDTQRRDRAMTPAERQRLFRNLRVKRTGHAAQPGTGPDGQKCGSCAHLARLCLAKTFFKCELMRQHWTGGAATDIKFNDPACRKWEAKSYAKSDTESESD